MGLFRTEEGSSGRLGELCAGYFAFYVVYTMATKYLTGPARQGLPGVNQLELLIFSTLGGSLICLLVVLLGRWARMESAHQFTWGKTKFPAEYFYIIPSGICTAVVIPATTLMYTLLRSVMVAMLIMRGSIIILSRMIDAIQIKQGLLKKKIYWEEEAAVVFAVAAVSLQLFFVKDTGGADLVHNVPAMLVLGGYLLAYFLRIYIMNYYKNTRGKGQKQDNKGFFAVEQAAASATILAALLLIAAWPAGGTGLASSLQHNLWSPSRYLPGEVLAGAAYGIVAFFSVFIFMFKGRTATFAGLANRLTSLAAGTAATLLFAVFFNGKYPRTEDWLSLVLIIVSVGFMTRAELKRTRELRKDEVL
jgi:hypothetical protein